MKAFVPNPPAESVSCSLFGHRYYVVQHFAAIGRRLACHGCNVDLLAHDKLQEVAPWPADADEVIQLATGVPVVKPLYQLFARKLG